MERQLQCYMCERPATSKEHVPPLCLFPELKDVHGHDFRKNLIKVPSCDSHNMKKSDDDEFLMIAIAGVVGNNFLGFHQTQTKISRALRRKSKHFLNEIVIRKSQEKVINTPKLDFPVLIGNPDIPRLIKCFEHIVHGIYFHEYKKRFHGKIKMLFGFIRYHKPNDQTMIDLIKRKFEIEELALKIKGDNPEVFTYQFCKPDHFGLIGLKLVFYGGTEVFTSLIPDGVKLEKDLIAELIRTGISTTITLGNEEFEFNKKK